MSSSTTFVLAMTLYSEVVYFNSKYLHFTTSSYIVRLLASMRYSHWNLWHLFLPLFRWAIVWALPQRNRIRNLCSYIEIVGLSHMLWLSIEFRNGSWQFFLKKTLAKLRLTWSKFHDLYSSAQFFFSTISKFWRKSKYKFLPRSAFAIKAVLPSSPTALTLAPFWMSDIASSPCPVEEIWF